MESLEKIYNEVFYERADPRVKDWTYMRSPVPLFFTLIGYLVTIKLILPAYMKDRPPYELRTVIKWYNVLQIIANTVVTWGIITSGWTTTYHFGCLLPDYSTNPEPMRMLRFMWWTVMIKLLELIETVFFILRKKNNQASFLHVHHHVTSMILIWTAVKYIGGGMTSFNPMLNNTVHIIMYSYYLLSAEGTPKVKNFLRKHKKWITILQMVQFTVLLIHASQVYQPSCNVPSGVLKFVTAIYVPNVIIVYFMFYKFFKNSFGSKKKSLHNGKCNGVKTA